MYYIRFMLNTPLRILCLLSTLELSTWTSVLLRYYIRKVTCDHITNSSYPDLP